MEKIKYKCQKCNKDAVFGEHFCKPADIIKYEKELNHNPDKDLGYNGDGNTQTSGTLNLIKMVYGLAFIVGSILIFVLLQNMLGNFALPVLVAFYVFVLIFVYRTKIFGTSHRKYKQLVKLCHDDAAVAERLINSEYKKNINIKRDQAIALAHDRLLQDRLR